MNTATETIPIPFDVVLTMLNSMSRHNRRRLAELMSEQLEREGAEAEASWKELIKTAPSWEEEDNANLDAFLASISGNWEGDGDPTEIARELRQGSEVSRNVETW